MTTAAIAAGATGAGVSWHKTQPGDSEVVELGADFWSLRFEQPGGGELALDSLRGGPLLLNFWATWCPPCIKELPDLDRLQREHAAHGVQVVGLAVDGPTPVRQFLARQPVSFAVGLAGFEGTDLSRRLGNVAGALPFTVVIDRQGVVRHRKLGPTEFAELAGWVGQL